MELKLNGITTRLVNKISFTLGGKRTIIYIIKRLKLSYRKMKYQFLLIIFLFFIFPFSFAQEEGTQPKKPVSKERLEEEEFHQMLINEMDKMLDLWYIKKESSNSKNILSKVQDDTITNNFSDSLTALRLKNIITVIPLAYNSRTKSMINLYLNRKRSSAAILGLAQYYYPIMQEIFDKYDVPEELIYLTIIESSLNPTAVSRAGATGIWQFMYSTGKMYGLEVNTFVDDRRDPIKATDAAARHLRDLYNMFQDWGLAISAYNCGPGNVRKAIQRSGGKTNFWDIINFLPKETRSYFPAYIGAFYMMKYHHLYGIQAPSIAIPTAVDTVMVTKEIHLEQVANVLNIDIEEIRTLNPQYKKDVIPAYNKPFPLRLRSKDIIRFVSLSDSVYNYEYDFYFAPLRSYVNVFTGSSDEATTSKKKYHTVRSGESLTKIANKYGLSVDELKQMNKLKSNYIKPKMKLVVGYEITPISSEGEKDVVKSGATGQDSTKVATTPPPPRTTYYIVKKGDTLSKIASRYKVSVKDLAKYNAITNINSLRVGQKIKIPQ